MQRNNEATSESEKGENSNTPPLFYALPDIRYAGPSPSRPFAMADPNRVNWAFLIVI